MKELYTKLKDQHVTLLRQVKQRLTIETNKQLTNFY